MTICFYAGSFDPFTIGHLHVVRNASIIYDKVIIGIGINTEKERYFDRGEMKQAIYDTVSEEHLENVEVILYDEYTADVAKTIGVTHFIRGIRNSKDYEYEKKIANYNFEHSGIRTIYIGAEEYEQISSSAVRERIFRQDSTDNLVPKAIQKIIKK